MPGQTILIASDSSVLQGEHTEALGKYAMALSYINDDFMVQLHGPHAAKAGAVKQPVHLNMAACQLKLKDWQGASWNCSQVSQSAFLVSIFPAGVDQSCVLYA